MCGFKKPCDRKGTCTADDCQYDHDSFGRVIRDTNPGFQPFGFQGGLARICGLRSRIRLEQGTDYDRD